MPLRAFRLFPMLTTTELTFATSSSFTLTLQIAAGRAWSRRAIAHAQPNTEDTHGTTRGKKLSKPGSSFLTAGPSRMPGAKVPSCSDAQVDGNLTACFPPTVLRGKQKQSPVHIPPEGIDMTGTVPRYIYFDPVMNNYEPTPTDLFSEEAPIRDSLKDISSKDLSEYLTTVSVEPLLPGSFLLPIPTSARSLYHNLIHILRTRKPPPTLPALIDYHLLFPKCHSTRSYNLLIFLSLRHRSFGITQSLFHEMQRRSIQNNIETYQLHVRWFIYQGFWDKAWSYVMQLMNKFPGGTIPFPIWLEFCHTRKGRTIIREDEFNQKKMIVHKLVEPSSLFSARRKIMNTNRPLSIPTLKDTPPAAIRNIVQLMVKAKLRRQAIKLTEDYFKALPLQLGRRMNHRCLDIIKVHLVFNGTGKTGLPRFNAAKTLLFSLLSSNPSLRPTSDTVLFILSTLGKAKRCGTKAWNFLSFCKEKWGPEVEDRRVQRRVSKWALKEGRMDIVATILRAEAFERRSRERRLLELKVLDQKRPRAKVLLRPSVRRIYPRNGREARLWRRLRIRIRHKIFKHIAQGRQFIKTRRMSALDSMP
ncbi:hypothetical protein BYT27DRAFT_6564472 [Phlegmacium glaucopus]|nr:hypothetical protein BYT27DRAFT_6564472 [Phlegmacium glaucopus]